MKNSYELSEEIKNIIRHYVDEEYVSDIAMENMRQSIEWCLEDSDK